MLSRLNAARKSTPSQLGSVPLVVLTRGLNTSPDQQAAHAEIAKLSRNSRHTVVPGSYHEIHLSHPEAVASAILEVVAAVREGRALRRGSPSAGAAKSAGLRAGTEAGFSTAPGCIADRRPESRTRRPGVPQAPVGM